MPKRDYQSKQLTSSQSNSVSIQKFSSWTKKNLWSTIEHNSVSFFDKFASILRELLQSRIALSVCSEWWTSCYKQFRIAMWLPKTRELIKTMSKKSHKKVVHAVRRKWCAHWKTQMPPKQSKWQQELPWKISWSFGNYLESLTLRFHKRSCSISYWSREEKSTSRHRWKHYHAYLSERIRTSTQRSTGSVVLLVKVPGYEVVAMGVLDSFLALGFIQFLHSGAFMDPIDQRIVNKPLLMELNIIRGINRSGTIAEKSDLDAITADRRSSHWDHLQILRATLLTSKFRDNRNWSNLLFYH